MRRTTSLILMIVCGVIFVPWLLGIGAFASGLAFDHNPSIAEYVCLGLIGLFSGYGLYAGFIALMAPAAKTLGTQTTGQSAMHGPVRIVGRVLVIFGVIGLYTIAQIIGQHVTSDFLVLMVTAALGSLLLGGACLFMFRVRSK